MKNILIVLGDYYLGKDPNGNCIRKIVDYWHSHFECSVDLVCVEPADFKIKKNNHFSPVLSKRYSNNDFIENIFKLIHIPLTNKRTLASLIEEIRRKISEKEYAFIISVINPTESAQAVYEVKKNNPSIRTILYEIDPSSNRYKYTNNLFKKFWRIQSMRWEKRMYSSFDKVIHMKTHKSHFSKPSYDIYSEKIVYLDIPGVEPHISTNNTYNTRIIQCIYAGAFYPDIRRPDYMIAFFSALSRLIDVRLDIYTDRMIGEIKKLIGNNECIQIHNVIPEKEIVRIQKSMEALVSIGNKDSDFLPSKILAYISSGKVIIHFFDNSNDVSLSYLQRYPKTILIDQRLPVNSNVEKFLSEIANINKISVTNDFIMSEFYENTVEYTAKIIYDII